MELHVVETPTHQQEFFCSYTEWGVEAVMLCEDAASVFWQRTEWTRRDAVPVPIRIQCV